MAAKLVRIARIDGNECVGNVDGLARGEGCGLWSTESPVLVLEDWSERRLRGRAMTAQFCI